MATYTYTGPRDTLQGEAGSSGTFTVTDWTEDTTLDCDTDNAALGNVLGTLIKALIDKGIITGSVTDI